MKKNSARFWVFSLGVLVVVALSAVPLGRYAASQAYASPLDSSSPFENALVDAADSGNLDAIQSMVRTGTYVDSAGRFGATALMRAAFRENEDIVRFLLSMGANPDTKDVGGATALHLAARRGQTQIVTLLTEAGANVNAQDNEGWTPLMRAALHSHVETAEILLNASADANATNAMDESALQHASFSGSGPIAHMLIAAGADTGHQDMNGITAAEIAYQRGFDTIQSMLASPAQVQQANAEAIAHTADASVGNAISHNAVATATAAINPSMTGTARRAFVAENTQKHLTGMAAEPTPIKADMPSTMRRMVIANEEASFITDAAQDKNVHLLSGKQMNPALAGMQRRMAVADAANNNEEATIAKEILLAQAQQAPAVLTPETLPTVVPSARTKVLTEDAYTRHRLEEQTKEMMDTRSTTGTAAQRVPSSLDTGLGNLAPHAGPAPKSQASAIPQTLQTAPPQSAVRYLLQLGTFDDRNQAGDYWNMLVKDHKDLLNNLTPIVSQVAFAGNEHVAYRTQAGYLQSRDMADAVCRELYARQTDCFVVESALAVHDTATTVDDTARSGMLADASRESTTPEPFMSATETAMMDAVDQTPNSTSLAENSEPMVFGDVSSVYPELAPLPDVARPTVSAQAAMQAMQDELPDVSAPATASTQTAMQNAQEPLPRVVRPKPSLPWTSTPAIAQDTVLEPTPAAKAIAAGSISDTAVPPSALLDVPVQEEFARLPSEPRRLSLSELPQRSAFVADVPPTLPASTRTAPIQRVAAQQTMPAPQPMLSVPASPQQPAFRDYYDGTGAYDVNADVQVAEAIRVPLTDTSPSAAAYTPPAAASKPLAKQVTLPSQNTYRKSDWVQISAFQNDRDARAFWDTASATDASLTSGLRMRVTKPLKGRGATTSVRVGPLRSDEQRMALCDYASAQQLHCSTVREMGTSAALYAPRGRGNGAKEIYQRRMREAQPRTTGMSAFWVQLGTFANQDAAYDHWSIINTAHGDLLEGLTPSVSSPALSSSPHPTDRLRVGPFYDRMQASMLCTSLQQRGVSCLTLRSF